MYATINLEGRLVNEPEVKQGREGHEFCVFRVAVNQQYGETDTTSFYNCVGGSSVLRRILNAGLTKGRIIHITGNIKMKTYTDKNGVSHLSPEISILDWHFVGVKPKGDQEHSGDYGQNNGYGAAPGGYNQNPQNGYPGAPAGYNQPAVNGYGSAPNGFNAPPVQQQGYGSPNQGRVNAERYMNDADDLPV